MKLGSFLLAAALALSSALAMSASLAAAAEGLKVGDQAPDFTLVGSDGKTYKLADFQGKQAVVLAWFPRAFTPGCTKECKAFKEQGQSIRDYNVAYFTASTDPPEQNKKFAESLSVDYPILSDPEGKTAMAYGVYNSERKAAQRQTFYIGKNGKILFIDNAVKTESHGTDVAKKLDELKVEKKK